MHSNYFMKSYFIFWTFSSFFWAWVGFYMDN